MFNSIISFFCHLLKYFIFTGHDYLIKNMLWGIIITEILKMRIMMKAKCYTCNKLGKK